MPPKKTPIKTAGPSCSTSEVALMLAILRQIDRPAIDMDALAETIGAASANAARMRITAAVAKHGWFNATAATGTGSSPKNPRSKKAAGPSSGRKKKASAEDSDDQELGTPQKKKRQTSDAKDAIKTEPAEEPTTHGSDGSDALNEASERVGGDDGI
ncbi:hypothetical protein CI238_10626 [Colletotrichum incanum]|uniref:Myb-like DNA-binding domain-containing protein n=1 Tax=Colletotrichum incanum TaxID=1573173 RepID=A0A161W3G8_COLIC|nr:hypothetical protein CI238_10626 [Colletotrichum incanum]